MEMVLLTALGVGGATVVGAALGFVFKNMTHKAEDAVLGFAAGVMLAAAVVGLILPSLDHGGSFGIAVTVAGVFAGALCLNVIDKIVPHLHGLAGTDKEMHPLQTERLNKVLLFVMAIAIHNLPEGIAAGVGFGTENIGDAMTVALGIALQNIPEGMVIIAPMLAAGIKPARTFLIASMTGMIEVLGTLLGFTAVNLATGVLPFALAFAGGSMLYVISDEMIPETHAHGNERESTYSLIAGFCLMLVLGYFLG